jgi:two-component system response regulator HydG
MEPTSRKLLVVDDDANLRTTLAAGLELEGYEVVQAPSGTEAIEYVRRESFDLVVTDVQMPDIHGVDTLRAIKQLRPDTAVVMMTGSSFGQLVEEGLFEGAYTVVHKPFSMDHMVRIIGRAVRTQVVLVVDDVPEYAASVVQALQAVGQHAKAVHDGFAAVREVAAHMIDVSVLDLVMPCQDGFDTYEQLHYVDPTVAVIAMTGYEVPEKKVGALVGHGGSACLRKPFDVKDLVWAIARARGDPERR